MKWLLALLIALISGGAMAQGYVGPGSGITIIPPSAGAIPRTLGQRAAECDAGGTNCALYNVKDYGLTPANSSANNLTALTTVLGLVCGAGGNRYKAIHFPAGFYPIDTTTSWSINCLNVGISGEGQATVLRPFGTGDAWVVPPAISGQVSFRGFQMFRADNPASGRAFLIERGPIDFDEITISGAYQSVELMDVLGFNSTNVKLLGSNNNAGSFGLRVHRASSVSSNNSLIFLSNWDASVQGVDNQIVINQYDGFNMVSGHVWMATGDCILSQPEFTNDQLTGLNLQGVKLDTCANGFHAKPLGGYTGSMGFDSISGSAQLMTNDGILLEDAAMNQLSLPGFIAFEAQHNGVEITAGTYISWTGGAASGNNASAGTYADLAISGTASYVIASGLTMTARSGFRVQDHIQIADPVNHVSIGRNVYQGATGKDVNNTSAQTDIHVAQGATDLGATNWDWRVRRGANQERQILADGAAVLLDLTINGAANGNEVWPLLQAQASGSAALFGCSDTAGTGNCNSGIIGNGIGTVTLGLSTNTVDIPAAVVLLSQLPTSAPGTHCQLWASSGVLTLTTCP